MNEEITKKQVYKNSSQLSNAIIAPGSIFSIDFKTIGFQSSNLYTASQYLKQILDKKIPLMLGFTSNAVTSGLREHISFICKQFNVIGLVTTAGGIEQDFIKSYLPFKLIDTFNDITLRANGLNRSGNIIIENNSYIFLEKTLKQVLGTSINSTPSLICDKLGEISNDMNSILRVCHLKTIPIFCYSLLDGAIGDYIYFNTTSGVLDVYADHMKFLDVAVRAENYAVLVLGGSTPKHAVMNAGLIRGGCDYAIHLTTEHDFDGSNAGASLNESVSWGKIKEISKSIKVVCDFTIALPIILSLVFNK